MEHIRDEIRIEAPVDHVWKFLCDTARWSDWMPRGQFSDFSGPYDRIGTTYTWKMQMMGFKMEGTSTVLEVEPLKLIHERTENGMEDNYFRFTSEGDATRLVVESDYEVPGHIPGFLKHLMTKAFFERQTRHLLGDFKALAEASVAVPV